MVLVEVGPQKRERLFVALEGEDPNTSLAVLEHRVEQETPVARPASGILALVGFQQELLIPRAAGQLLIEVVLGS